MRIIISIEHPAWAHQFRYLIKDFQKKGHDMKVVAINKDRDIELLDLFNIDYEVISDSSGKNFLEKGIIFLNTTLKIFLISRKFKPDLFIGRASPMMAINSFLFRKKHILYEDTEHSTFSLLICRIFSDFIITPDCFRNDLGKKQIRANTYKELFYLHPDLFKPNPSTLTELGLNENDKFIIVRFVAWDAHHDIGQSGISNKIDFVHEIEKYAKVLITSEGPLPQELENYKIRVSPEKIHDLLFYATLCIGEGATVASECAVLGTHAVYISTLPLGYTTEQGEKYNLVFTFSDRETMEKEAFSKAIELLNNPNLKESGKEKRIVLLKEKINGTEYMENFILNILGKTDLLPN